MTDFFKNKKIAVPGGGGFFGSHLVPRLDELGAKVFVPRQNQGWDFRKWEDAVRLYQMEKFDLVINLAAHQGGIGFHKGRQAELYFDNIRMGTFLMQAACEAGVPKFVNVVAGCSYPGYLEKEELDEEDYWRGEVHRSIFSYGFPRKASVVQGLALQKQFGFNSVHLVYANMYGPGEHFNPEQSKALAGLLKKAYEAKKKNLPSVEVWGTGKPVRDWLYVKDGVEGLVLAAEKYESVEPLNIASGYGISVKDLAELIKRVAGFKGELRFDTEKPDGALRKIFGVKKMQAALGWLPNTDLETGIRETLEWLDKNYEYAIEH